MHLMEMLLVFLSALATLKMAIFIRATATPNAGAVAVNGLAPLATAGNGGLVGGGGRGAALLELEAVNGGPTAGPLGCHKRLYTYRVTQADARGHECWDYVSVMSCWGRCDSSEISDWKFPYKRSFHPVCVHDGRQPSVAVLRNCHPDAGEEARRYEYMEAMNCHCHTCSTLDTSCEAPANNVLDEKSGVKMLSLTGADSNGLDY